MRASDQNRRDSRLQIDLCFAENCRHVEENCVDAGELKEEELRHDDDESFACRFLLQVLNDRVLAGVHLLIMLDLVQFLLKVIAFASKKLERFCGFFVPLFADLKYLNSRVHSHHQIVLQSH